MTDLEVVVDGLGFVEAPALARWETLVLRLLCPNRAHGGAKWEG